VLNQNIQKQNNNHAELLSQSSTVSTNMNALQASSTYKHEAIVSGLSHQSLIVNRKLKRIENHSSLTARKMKKAQTSLDRIRQQNQHIASQISPSMDTMSATLQEIHTQTSFTASEVSMAPRIVREELRTTLKPIIEQNLTASHAQIQARLQHMEDLIQQIVHDVGVSGSIHCSNTSNEIIRQQKDTSSTSGSEHTTHKVIQSSNPTSIAEPVQLIECGSHHSVSTYRRTWTQSWRMGSLKVGITQVIRRIDGSPYSNSTVEIQIHFLPSQTFLRIPGVSIVYTTAPSSAGYYHLAPMVTMFSIIDPRHPVYNVLRSGDIEKLQNMLARGNVSLRCEDEYGLTLLHVSITDLF
jgi:hypothetical protein